jgi:hypothetical protein
MLELNVRRHVLDLDLLDTLRSHVTHMPFSSLLPFPVAYIYTFAMLLVFVLHLDHFGNKRDQCPSIVYHRSSCYITPLLWHLYPCTQ